MKLIFVLSFLVALHSCNCADAAPRHACSSDAIVRAKELLAFYRRPDQTEFVGQWSIEESVRHVGTIAAMHGRRRYDILEVWGNVYKGRYRMRFDYATIGKDCVLMGEEILEDALL